MRFTQKFITSSLVCQILFEALFNILKAVRAVILHHLVVLWVSVLASSRIYQSNWFSSS